MDTVELLRKQIQDMVIPPLPSQAEQDQIMKGRKGQADIDAGRRAIQERIDAHNRAVQERSTLTTQLTTLEKEGRQRGDQQAREKAANPWTDTFLPFAAGAGVGGVYGELTNRGLDRFERGNARALNEIAEELGPTDRLTGSQMNRARAVGAAEASRRFAPTGIGKVGAGVGRAASYGIPAGVVYNEYRNYQARANDANLTETERQANQQIANGLLGVTTGIGVEGGRRFFFPSRHEGSGRAMMRVEAARELARRMDDGPARRDPYTVSRATPAASPGPQVDPERMAELRGRRAADLRADAKAMGLHTSGTKEDLARRIAEGPTNAPRRLPRGTAGLLAPFAAGAVAYDAASNDAEAAGATSAEARGRGVAAGGVAAGATYGLSKLAPYAIDAISKTPLGRVAARAFPPAAAAMTAYDVGSMAVEENAKPDTMLEGPAEGTMPQAPGNPAFMARQQALARQTRGEQPLRSAAALEIPAIRPGAAMRAERQAVMNEDDFDAQLAAFMQAVEEHNAGVGEAYGP